MVFVAGYDTTVFEDLREWLSSHSDKWTSADASCASNALCVLLSDMDATGMDIQTLVEMHESIDPEEMPHCYGYFKMMGRILDSLNQIHEAFLKDSCILRRLMQQDEQQAIFIEKAQRVVAVIMSMVKRIKKEKELYTKGFIPVARINN